MAYFSRQLPRFPKRVQPSNLHLDLHCYFEGTVTFAKMYAPNSHCFRSPPICYRHASKKAITFPAVCSPIAALRAYSS
eukprot:3364517-Pleurochrysis_carterae.AAC.3